MSRFAAAGCVGEALTPRRLGVLPHVVPKSTPSRATYSFFFDPEGLPTSSWCLLRRWTGDPPETLSGLTYLYARSQ